MSALLISIAQASGSSGLSRKTSAPPSPVGKRNNLPSAAAARNCFRYASDFPQFLQLFGLFVDEQLGITYNVDEQNMPDFELHIGFGRHVISLP